MQHLFQTEAERARTVPAGDGWPGMTVWEACTTGARSAVNGKTFGPSAWQEAGMKGSSQTLQRARQFMRDTEREQPPEPRPPAHEPPPALHIPAAPLTADAFDALGEPPRPAASPVTQAGRVRLLHAHRRAA